MVAAGGYEFPEGWGSIIEVLPEFPTIGITLGPPKEIINYVISITSGIPLEKASLLRYPYPDLGLYDLINPHSKGFKVVIGGIGLFTIRILLNFLGTLGEFIVYIINNVGPSRSKKKIRDNARSRTAVDKGFKAARATVRGGGGSGDGDGSGDEGDKNPGKGGGLDVPTVSAGFANLRNILRIFLSDLNQITTQLDNLPPNRPIGLLINYDFIRTVNGINNLSEFTAILRINSTIRELINSVNNIDALTGILPITGQHQFYITDSNVHNFRNALNIIRSYVATIERSISDYLAFFNSRYIR